MNSAAAGVSLVHVCVIYSYSLVEAIVQQLDSTLTCLRLLTVTTFLLPLSNSCTTLKSAS